MKFPAKFFALSSCAMLLSLGAGAATYPGWSLVWSDEFAQADGSSPDPTKWVFETGNNGGWGNSELEFYTTRTNNARVVGGMLVIEAAKEITNGFSYTSARMKTQGKWSWQYGRMEARIKIPRGQGIWPAFWMMGTNITPVGWPGCGEIDIMENVGRETNFVHGTIHGPGYSGGNGITGQGALPGNPALADDFHIYAVEWTTNLIKWFVDGYQYTSANPARLPGGTTWVFTNRQFILLNLAVGGQWPGNPDTNTIFPQRMTVDYIRVYAPTNLLENKTNLLSNAGFEAASLANWKTYGAGFNTLQENIADVAVHNGTNVFKVFGQFNGVANRSGAFQDVPAGAGQALRARGWMFTAGDDQIGGGNTAWIEVSFRNASSNILSLYRSTPVSASTPAGLWLNCLVTNQLNPANFAIIGSATNLVAPAGTTFVRYEAAFQQPATIGGSAFFDDLQLTTAGTVAIPVPVTMVRTGSNLNLTFGTYLNLPYQINSKDLLAAPGWGTFTNLSGSGTSLTVTVDPQAAARFFQVSRVCN